MTIELRAFYQRNGKISPRNAVVYWGRWRLRCPYWLAWLWLWQRGENPPTLAELQEQRRKDEEFIKLMKGLR